MKKILLTALILLCGCRAALPAATAPTSSPAPPAATAPALLRCLALGDSYTVGQGVPADDSFPSLLAEVLEAQNHAVEMQVIARTGWTTSELLAGIEAEDPAGPFDIVTLLIGVNDQFRGASPEDYADSFKDALATAVAYSGGNPGRVFVLSIPDWGASPMGSAYDISEISRQIDAFNAVNRSAAGQSGVHYVDITALTRAAAGDAALFAADGLHYSERMHARWVELLLPLLLETIQ